MTTKEINDTLREACRRGDIKAWSQPVYGAIWYIQPLTGETRQMDWKMAHDFASMLEEANAA